MCVPAIIGALGLGGGAAAAGAGAAAATTAVAGTGLATIGTAISVTGALLQGIMGMNAANEQAAAIADQRATESAINATQDQRRRAAMMSDIRKQTAELAARGIALDSVTAIQLGQTAAAEMSFDSQAVRSTGAARSRELTASERAARAQGVSSLLRGGFSAAGTVISAAPDIWPGLLR